MFETNEEMEQKLKQTICDYYMGYIKPKLKYLLANGNESEISNQIMQFLDAQFDTRNYTIVKDDIVRILETVLFENVANIQDLELEKNRIPYYLPNVATVTIEVSGAAYLTEQIETPLNGFEENSYYLYVSPDYYTSNIETIENDIKKLEKGFSRQDFKGFEKKFEKDLSQKQYELESAKVYESASKQIELKKQKFNSVSQKMINEYGKKYDEIMGKDISQEEKLELTHKLFEETKSYDERNRQSVSRLNTEYEKLIDNFQGKVQNSQMIYKQMQNLHLFDKNRYFEDMMASVTPALRDLYKKKYLLNSYRISHGESVYTGKPNAISNIFENVIKTLRKNTSVPALGPHFERDLPTRSFGNSNTKHRKY